MSEHATTERNGPLCEVCGGSGFEIVEGKGARECECRRDARIKKWLVEARIPVRFNNATFDCFNASTPSLQRALVTARQFAADYPKVEAGLLFLGNPGVGKTHLAIATLRAVIERGHQGLFYDTTELLREIQDSYNPATQTSEMALLRPVFDVPLLVFDELGITRPTEWVLETIALIMSRRYNANKVTILTTNYLDNPTTAMLGETLQQRIGPRLRSRLHEMCRLVSVDAPDYREKLRDQRGARVLEVKSPDGAQAQSET